MGKANKNDKSLGRTKKTYTSYTGLELNITFVPMIVQELYEEYINAQRKILDELPEYQAIVEKLDSADNKAVERVQSFRNTVKHAQETGMNIVRIVLDKNGQDDITDEQLKQDLDSSELAELINCIMRLDESETKKKPLDKTKA